MINLYKELLSVTLRSSKKKIYFLKNILREITNTFGRNAKGRTERELLDDILNIIMHYNDVFKEEAP